MKPILASLVALLVAICAIPLRNWSGLDTQRAAVNRWLWLRSEIVNPEPRRIDYAFTGSSQTLSAVKPSVIARLEPGAVAYNFAHFGWGHDADYFVAKPLLERHDVGTLVIEIPPRFPLAVHNQTRHLIGAGELGGELRAALNELALRDLLLYSSPLKQRLDRIASYLAVSLLSFPRHLLELGWVRVSGGAWEYREGAVQWRRGNGYPMTEKRLEADPEFRARQRAHGSAIPRMPAPPAATGLPHPARGSRSEFYLERLRGLALETDTRLVFAYIPPWRARPPSHELHAFYRRFGEVLIPDLRRLHQPSYYIDPIHLYDEGADAFTKEVLRLLSGGTSPYADLYLTSPDAPE